MRLIYDFLCKKYPGTDSAVNKKAAARALAHSANPNPYDKKSHEDSWRTRVRGIVERCEAPVLASGEAPVEASGEAFGEWTLVRPSILEEMVDAIRGIGPDGKAWFDDDLETSPSAEQQELADEWGVSIWELWNLRFRSFPELDANEKAFKDLSAWREAAVDQYGSQATKRELRKAIERVQPLWAFLSDSEQRRTLDKALKEAGGWLSWEAKVAGRKSIVAKRRHGEPTPKELADLLKEEKEHRAAVKGGAELPDRQGDGGMTWTELFGSQADAPQEKVKS